MTMPAGTNGSKDSAMPPGVKSGADTAEFMYLSQLLGARVRREGEPKPFGRLYDLGVRRIVAYPQTVSIDVKTHGKHVTFSWSSVKEFSPRGIVVGSNGNGPSPAEGLRPAGGTPPADFWVRRDVLDDQVVDVKGARVRRVNDVHLLYAEGHLMIGHVEVGMLGILRRLGFERPVQRLLRWLLDLEVKDEFLGWRNMEVLSPGGSPGGLKISGEPGRLAEMAPAELADILEELGVKERQTVFDSLSVETAAEALEATDPDVQRSIISEQEPGKAADILEEMDATGAADVLREIHAPDAQRIVGQMETGASEEVRLLLEREEKTAGAVLETSCVTAGPLEEAGAVIGRIRSGGSEIVELGNVYVLDAGRRLIGVLSLHELLAAPGDTPIEELMTMPVISTDAGTSLRDVAVMFVKHGFRNLPVVDANRAFIGVVRIKNVLDEIRRLPGD